MSTMHDAARLRSINLGQLATPTDRMLMLGRLRKLEDQRHRPCAPSSDVERTFVVRQCPARARSFVPAAVLAAAFGIASLITVRVGTSHASTATAITVHGR